MAFQLGNFKFVLPSDMASFSQNMAYKSLVDMPYDTTPFIHPNDLSEFRDWVNYSGPLDRCVAYYKDKPHLRIE